MKRKLFALLAILALFAGSACSDDDEPAVDAGNDTEQGDDSDGGDAEKITIAMEDRKFVDVPATLEGGFVEIEAKNNGKLKHEAGFVKVEKAYASDADFIKAFKPVISDGGNPIPAEINAYFGPFADIEGGQSVTGKQSLPAGDYYLVCTFTDADSNEEEPQGGEEPPKLPTHMEQGMIQKVKVTGPATVAPPTGETVITAKEYTFDVKGLTAGKKEAVFVNDPAAKEIHMAVVMEFGEGVDEAAAQKAVEAFGGDGPPPAGTPEPEEAGFSGVFSPGGASTLELDLKSGRVYAFLCFIQDRAGGPPHVAKGMVTLKKVA